MRVYSTHEATLMLEGRKDVSLGKQHYSCSLAGLSQGPVVLQEAGGNSRLHVGGNAGATPSGSCCFS